MFESTFLSGCLKLKNATDKDITLIKDFLNLGSEYEYEKVKIKNENEITTMDFESIRWLGGLNEDKINEMLKKLKKKKKLVSYRIILYFLDGKGWHVCFGGIKK